MAQMPREQAAQVRDAIGRIRSYTQWRRHHAMARHESEAKRALDEIDRDYRTALESMQLQEPPDVVRDNGLRQLLLTERPPGIRILYGVNSAKEVALIVRGEHLDRRAYGPSVRTALSTWEQFLTKDEAAGLGSFPTSRRVV